MKGTLYGVSVGPGDPKLMTLKAVRIINACRIIAAPRTNGENSIALEIVKKVCDISKKQILYFDFPMSNDKRLLEESHKSIAEKLAEYLETGADIAFLNIGDISVYSTFSYILPFIKENGSNVEMCPGVTSFCAASSALKRELVYGKEPFTVIPALCGDSDRLLENEGTAVIMKKSDSSEIKPLLKKYGFESVYTVCNCGLENEKIYEKIESIPDKCGYFTVIIAKKK